VTLPRNRRRRPRSAAFAALLATAFCAGCVGPIAEKVAELRHRAGIGAGCDATNAAASEVCDAPPPPGRFHPVPTRPVFATGHEAFY
jgi:hypothetical protein